MSPTHSAIQIKKPRAALIAQIDDLPATAFIRLPTVMAVCGVRRSAIYDWIQKSKFPPPERLSVHAAGWRVGAIRAWLENPTAWRAGEEPGGHGA